MSEYLKNLRKSLDFKPEILKEETVLKTPSTSELSSLRAEMDVIRAKKKSTVSDYLDKFTTVLRNKPDSVELDQMLKDEA